MSGDTEVSILCIIKLRTMRFMEGKSARLGNLRNSHGKDGMRTEMYMGLLNGAFQKE